MGQKGLVLLLSFVIAAGGIVFPSRGHLKPTLWSLPGIAGGGTPAEGRLEPHGPITNDTEKPRQPSPTYGALPLSFEANRGQTDPPVRFLPRIGPHAFSPPSPAPLLASA